MASSPPVFQIKPSDLPRPPKAALRVVQACANPEVTARELTSLVSADPGLTAELLRLVNSAYFGFAREIGSIPRAIAIIGQRALRNQVLCLAVRDALRASTIPGLDTASYMDDTLRRAVSARCLGEVSGLDLDECFTLGLLQDFGMLALFYAQPQQAGNWPALRLLNPEQRHAREAAEFGITHDRVGLDLARAWQLPEELARAVAGHHGGESQPASGTEPSPLTCVARAADWMTAVFSAEDKAAALKGCKSVLEACYQMDGAACEGLLEQVGSTLDEAAKGLGMRVSAAVSFDEVMREANLRLAEDNLSYQELTWRLQKALDERDRLAAELQQELELAREIQQSLLPKPLPRTEPVTGVNLSARQVSGDFYDHFQLDDGRVYFNVGDVSGKGMNAALLMAKTSSLFRCLGKTITDPARLLGIINAEICETSVHGMFVTMVAGIYDPARDQVRLVNAGHPLPLYLTPDGRCRQVNSSAPPLGILPAVEYPETELRLEGGSLYLYTDGLAETEETRRGTPDMVRLARTFLTLSKLSPKERVNAAIRELHDGTGALQDDVTLVIVEALASTG